VTGAILGLAIASWTSSTLVRFAQKMELRMASPVPLSPSVLAFTCALGLVSGVLFGVVPALRATRVNWSPRLKEQAGALSSGLAHTRLRQGLVVCRWR